MLLSLPEQGLEDPLLWYLLKEAGWFIEKSGSNGTYTGKCLWHSENRASMTYYPGPPARVKCFGCTILADFLSVIGEREFEIPFDGVVTHKVFTRRDELLAEYVAAGGLPINEEGQDHRRVASQVQQTLRVPGPLHCEVLERLTFWWHEQLLAPTRESERAYTYLLGRGVSSFVLDRCPVVGYMPFSEDVSWRVARSFDDLLLVSEQELAEERDWYRSRLPNENLEPHLDFLRSAQTFRQRLGVFSKTGRWTQGGRVMFVSTPGKGKPCFFQARVLPSNAQGRTKFLGPPFRKYPFRVSLNMLYKPGEEVPQAQVAGTIKTESPVGPLVGISHRICRVGFATLGESTPAWELLRGLEEPIWRSEDNDPPKMKAKKLHYSGEEQSLLWARVMDQHGAYHERLRPPMFCKGFDEWVVDQGKEVVIAVMRAILESGGDLPYI